MPTVEVGSKDSGFSGASFMLGRKVGRLCSGVGGG